MLKTNGGGICDHEVGAGKTLIMCTESGEGSLSPSNEALCQRPPTLASDTVNLTLPQETEL